MDASPSPPSTPTFEKPSRFFTNLGRSLPFIIWPILATAAWISNIAGLLIWWAGVDDGKRYTTGDQTILYVSDVGAEHQALFIAGSTLTAIFYAITLVVGRYLRHLRRLPGVVRKRERVAGVCSIAFGWLGGLFLILLSALTNRDHSVAHWTCAAIFLGFVSLSALCQALEIYWLSRSHPDRRHLKRNFWLFKVPILASALVGALLFIILYAIGRSIWDDDEGTPTGSADAVRSAAAVTEWVVAFIFALYLSTFILDLWPAHKTRGLRFSPALLDDDRAGMLRRNGVGRTSGEMRQVGGGSIV